MVFRVFRSENRVHESCGAELDGAGRSVRKENAELEVEDQAKPQSMHYAVRIMPGTPKK